MIPLQKTSDKNIQKQFKKMTDYSEVSYLNKKQHQANNR